MSPGKRVVLIFELEVRRFDGGFAACMPMLERGPPAILPQRAPALRSFDFVNQLILGDATLSAVKFRVNSPDASRLNRSKFSLFES